MKINQTNEKLSFIEWIHLLNKSNKTKLSKISYFDIGKDLPMVYAIVPIYKEFKSRKNNFDIFFNLPVHNNDTGGQSPLKFCFCLQRNNIFHELEGTRLSELWSLIELEFRFVKNLLENINELKHYVEIIHKDNKLENMNKNCVRGELFSDSTNNILVNSKSQYKLEVEQIGLEELAESNMKIKLQENNFLCKKHSKTPTKYINYVYILDTTTVPDSVKKIFIKKVLEKNSEKLYRLSVRFLENLSALEKLIESLSKDLFVSCNSVPREENMWIGCICDDWWHEKCSNILENSYSKQNKKLNWRCSEYSKESKIFIKISVNTVKNNKIPTCQDFEIACSNFIIISTYRHMKCESNFNDLQEIFIRKNIMKWQYYQSNSQKINMDGINDSNISEYQININNSIKLKFLSYSTQIEMNSSDFIKTLNNEYISIRNYKPKLLKI